MYVLKSSTIILCGGTQHLHGFLKDKMRIQKLYLGRRALDHAFRILDHSFLLLHIVTSLEMSKKQEKN